MQWFFQDKQTFRNIIAILLPFLSAFLQYCLWDFLNPYIWIIFFPSIYISALLGNKRIGISATFFATLLGLYFFAPPRFTFIKEMNQYFASSIFFLSGFVFVIFHDQFKRMSRNNLRLIENTRLNERKHMEELLSLSEHKYSLIFDKSPFAIALAKFPESKVVAVNDSFLNLFEFTREEVIGKTTLELGVNTTESLGEVRKIMQEVGFVKNFETIRHTRSGKKIYINLNLNSFDLQGEQYTLATIEDITLQKKAEDAMQISENKYSLIFDKSPFAITIATFPESRFVAVNDSFLTMFEFKREEVIGKSTIELGLTDLQTIKEIEDNIKK